jgi:2-keto-4-pentenoate hydratase/2-oxohepta-3-ene-1,7-dioic acid hydratase in catechol pathway
MRFVRFRFNGTTHFGTTDGPHVVPFVPEIGSLQAYLALAPDERVAIPTGEPLALADVDLLAPVIPHKNVFCVGRNYLAHAEEGARAAGVELKLPDVPTFFTKAPTAIANPGQTLELSAAVTQQWDWEAELAVVIGTRCKDVSEEHALDVVFGYTCVNDVTARTCNGSRANRSTTPARWVLRSSKRARSAIRRTSRSACGSTARRCKTVTPRT